MERLSSPVTDEQRQTVEELSRIFHISSPVVSSLLQIHSHFALNSKWKPFCKSQTDKLTDRVVVYYQGKQSINFYLLSFCGWIFVKGQVPRQ